MTARRQPSNPLALAVLGLLYEQPMHPYQLASVMRERGKHESIKLNYGSLYTVIESLQRQQLIVPQGTLRDGRRPERTVYAATAAGQAVFLDWLRELLRVPVKEYTQFAAGLSFIASLPPEEAVALLRERAQRLAQELDALRATLAEVQSGGLPRLFLIEIEHELVLREAELAWVGAVAEAIADGTMEGMREWREYQAERAAAPDGERGADAPTGGQ